MPETPRAWEYNQFGAFNVCCRYTVYFPPLKQDSNVFVQVVEDFHGNFTKNPKNIDICTDGNQIFITFLKPNTSKESYKAFNMSETPLWSPI